MPRGGKRYIERLFHGAQHRIAHGIAGIQQKKKKREAWEAGRSSIISKRQEAGQPWRASAALRTSSAKPSKERSQRKLFMPFVHARAKMTSTPRRANGYHSAATLRITRCAGRAWQGTRGPLGCRQARLATFSYTACHHPPALPATTTSGTCPCLPSRDMTTGTGRRALNASGVCVVAVRD